MITEDQYVTIDEYDDECVSFLIDKQIVFY
jgi:hypothetical protein